MGQREELDCQVALAFHLNLEGVGGVSPDGVPCECRHSLKLGMRQEERTQCSELAAKDVRLDSKGKIPSI